VEKGINFLYNVVYDMYELLGFRAVNLELGQAVRLCCVCGLLSVIGRNDKISHGRQELLERGMAERMSWLNGPSWVEYQEQWPMRMNSGVAMDYELVSQAVCYSNGLLSSTSRRHHTKASTS
jgi:hypothetical protein